MELDVNNLALLVHLQPAFARPDVVVHLVVLEIVNENVFEVVSVYFADIDDLVLKVANERLFREQQTGLLCSHLEKQFLVSDAAIRGQLHINKSADAAED